MTARSGLVTAGLLAGTIALNVPAPSAPPEESAASSVEVARDLTYVATPPVDAGDTTLDLYFAAGAPGAAPAGASPIVVFVHGGGWRRGYKAPHAAKGERFAREGFLFASVNYRLHPAVDVATQADDVAQAFVSLALAAKTTGAVLTVDGGNIAAALR